MIQPQPPATRHPSEHRLPAWLDAVHCGLWVLDHEGNSIHVNHSMTEIVGLPAARILGRPLVDAIHPCDRDEVRRHLERRRRGVEDVHEFFFRRQSDAPTVNGDAADGVWTLISTAPLRDAEGGFDGAVAVVLPIDDQKQTELRLRHAADERGAELTAIHRQLIEEIEARRRAEERLEESRRFAVATLDALDAALAIVDAGGEVVAVNAAWTRQAGADPDGPFAARVGDDLVEALRAGGASGAMAALRDDLRRVIRGADERAERRVSVRRPGSAQHFDARVTSFRLGEAPHAVLAIQDATARVEAEQELADSEARFRLLAERSTDWITRHHPDGRYIWSSPACRRLLGYEPEELVGRDPYTFFHRDDIDAVRRSHETILAGPETPRVEYRFRRKDGSYVWLETTSHSIKDPETGGMVELHCASRDVTHRRETEAQLRLIEAAIEQVADAVVITEAELEPPGPRIQYVNRAFLDMTGYERDEIVGRSPRVLQGPDTEREKLDRLRETLRRGERFEDQTVNYRKDGTPYVLDWAITPVRDARGRIASWVSIQRDVTEKLKADAAQRDRDSELAHVARLSTMGEMASGLAHELNQPLAAIANYARGALNRVRGGKLSDDDLRGVIAEVLAQADRAGRIIQNLRGFVRKRESRPIETDVATLTDEVRTLLSHDLKRQGLKVAYVPEGDPPPVYVDQVQIEQVLLNLIRNAAEATPPIDPAAPRRRRDIEVRCRAQDDRWVRVSVVDRGGGVPPDQLDRVFDPFFTNKDGGMGMGLTISRSLVELHGGKLEAELNRPGPGLTFHFTVPVARGEAADDGRPASEPSP